MVELCLHLFVHFGCVAIYTFGFTTSSKEYLNNLDTKKVTDNKTVWRTVVPTFSNKNSKSNKIILNEESKTISDEKELCRTFSTYFASIDSDLKIPEIPDNASNIMSIYDPVVSSY